MKVLNYNKNISTITAIIFILIFTVQITKAACNQTDFNALKTFYESTNGDSWANNTGWELIRNNEVPPQNCNFRKLFGVRAVNGRVVGLRFRGPSEAISGTIPKEIYTLEKLESLEIYDNGLSGTIPNTIAYCNNLRVINLKNNNLIGTIPSFIGLLKNLNQLSLGDNQLIGNIPVEISNCANLLRLELYNNNLTGKIPTQIGQLTKMFYFNVSNNNISGCIPQNIGSCTNLSYCLLNDNNLCGAIPTEIGNLKRINYFYAMNNQLTGEIPHQVGQLNKMYFFNVSNNNITGSIPAEIGKCENLRYFIMSGNELDGNIPAEIGEINDLKKFYVNNNQLNGCYPEKLRKICVTLDKTANSNEKISKGNNFNENWENFDQYFMGVCENGNRIDNDKSEVITIYPNPSNGFINVSYTNENLNTNSPTELSIYNATGSEVFIQTINNQPSNNIPINVSHLTKGSYIVKINKAAEIYYEKLIIK